MPEGFGFKAWISTDDDEPLPEYGIETDLETNVITCWIPSEAGKKFKVMWSMLKHYKTDTRGAVTIDGINVGGKRISKRKSIRGALAVRDYVSTSPTTIRHFVFSQLKLTDDDSLISKSSSHDIGNISLNLSEIERGENMAITRPSVWEQHIAHEGSNKGLVHCVGFSPEEERRSSGKTHQRVSRDIQTYGTFIFRYRPLAPNVSSDVLQANGIAPPEPPLVASPPPDIPSRSSKKRKADAVKEEDNEVILNEEDKDLSEEIESIQARLRQLERETEMEDLRLRLRKLERKQGTAGTAKRVKTEPRSTVISGEVIDLI